MNCSAVAMTFDMIGERDSMLHYTQQATPYAQDTKGEVRATYLVNLASSKKAAGKQKEAKEYLQKALSSFPTDRGMQLLADIYMEEGDTIAAKEMWYRLTNSFSPDVSIQSYRMLIMYLKQRGDLKGVAEYSQRLNEVYNSLYERNDAAGIIELQKEYDEQREELHQYRLTIALLSAIILLIVAAIIFIRYSRKRIDARRRLERDGLFGRRVAILVLVVALLRKADVTDLALDGGAHRVGDLHHLLRGGDVFVVGLRGGIEHHRRETEFKRLHRALERETVVVVHHHRHGRALRRREERGGDERQVAVGQQHLGRAEDDRALQALGGLDGRLEHVGIRRVEQAHAVVFALRGLQDIIKID